MRKTLALFIAVLMLSLSLYTLVFAKTNKEKDNVTITEKFVYGDKAFAENVDINFKMLYAENLLWDITYDITEGTAKTDFSLYKDRIERDYESSNQLSLYTMLHYVSTTDGFYKETGLNKAYEELIETAKPYEETKKTVLLSDYLDYYPIVVDISFDGKFHLDSSFASQINDVKEKEFVAEFEEFFKIPILEGHKLVIGVQVDENRNVNSSGSYGNDGDETFEDFSFYAESVITDEECFIEFSNRTSFGNIVDTSEIPGGYGIYRLPYQSNDNGITFDTKGLKNIFPVKNEEEIYELQLSADKKELYMISKEDNKSFLTVIDAETYKQNSKITLSEIKDQSSYFGYIDEEFLVINHYHENLDSTFSVYTPDGNGGYKEEFTAFTSVADVNSSISEDEFVYYAGGSVYMNSNIDVKWDGENLYVTNTTDSRNTPTFVEGVSLSIYNKYGLQFCGYYKTSLSTGNDGYQGSRYYTRVSDYDLVEIKLN